MLDKTLAYSPPNVFNIGRTLMLETSNVYLYGQLWYPVRDRSFVVFKVKAANNARIGLSTMYRVVTDGAYEIVIGAAGNKRTYFRYKLGTETKLGLCIYGMTCFPRTTSGVTFIPLNQTFVCISISKIEKLSSHLILTAICFLGWRLVG